MEDAPSSADAATAVSSRRATIDVGAQVVGRAANLVLGVVATAILARHLGQARYGQWTTILVIPSLVAYLNDLGLQQVAVRRAASDDDARWLGAMVTARAALALPTFLVNVAVLIALRPDREMLIAGLIVAIPAFFGAATALTAVFQLRVRNDLTIVALTANSIVWTAAIIVISAHGGSLVAFAIAFTVIAALTIGFQAVLALRMIRVPLRGTRAFWRPLARAAVPLSIGNVLIIAYAKIDGLIVYTKLGATSAGLYGAAYRVLDQVGFVPLSLTVTLMPLIARAWPAAAPRVRALFELALELLAMISLPAFAFTLVDAHAVMTLLYGEAFAPASNALKVLMGAYVFICAAYVTGIFTIVLDLQRRLVRYAFAGLIFNVIANLVFVPRYGYIASAWITVATEVLVLGLIGRDVVGALHARIDLHALGRTALAAVFAGLAALAARSIGAGVIVVLAVTAAVQLAALLALGALRPREIRALLR